VNKRVKVKKQTEFSSKNWGIYIDGKLVEGGFFSKEAALDTASYWCVVK
jgi:hypothetical protein